MWKGGFTQGWKSKRGEDWHILTSLAGLRLVRRERISFVFLTKWEGMMWRESDCIYSRIAETVLKMEKNRQKKKRATVPSVTLISVSSIVLIS